MRSIEKGLEKAIRERGGRRSQETNKYKEQWEKRVSDFSRLSAYLVTILDPKSLAAEQFKRLRTQILKKMRARMENTILVTSAARGEGKTTTALNLAISFAQGLNETVLLIDADLRKPGMHHSLGIEVEKGLVDYLRGEAELADLLIKTEIPKLSLLPSGDPPENPSELLGSERMSQLIQEVRSRYEDRFIILDTSPINVFADTAILASMVEGVLLVIKDGVTPQEYVHRAISQLDNSKMLGICLNMISEPDSLQDAYYYYDYEKVEK
jgi:protein-tyrosine kinase